MLADSKISLCQQEIIKYDLQINAVIQDIRKCEGPLDALHQLNDDVRQLILKFKHHIQELESLAKEQDAETDKIALFKEVENHRKQLASTQASLRKANLMSQLAIESREKKSLLGSKTDGRSRGRSDKESMAKTTSEATESLMALSRTMSSLVSASGATVGTLVNSSGQVTSTQEEFKSMSGHIQISKKLLTRYSRRETTDKLLILLALMFFFATVLYIVKKRFFGATSILQAASSYTGGGEYGSGDTSGHEHTEM